MAERKGRTRSNSAASRARFQQQNAWVKPRGKQEVRQNDRPTRIATIEFTILSGPEIVRSSAMNVFSRDLYHMSTRVPSENGCLDRRLGISSKAPDAKCATCGKTLDDCVGHFGHIEFALPVFHIGWVR